MPWTSTRTRLVSSPQPQVRWKTDMGLEMCDDCKPTWKITIVALWHSPKNRAVFKCSHGFTKHVFQTSAFYFYLSVEFGICCICFLSWNLTIMQLANVVLWCCLAFHPALLSKQVARMPWDLPASMPLWLLQLGKTPGNFDKKTKRSRLCWVASVHGKWYDHQRKINILHILLFCVVFRSSKQC